MANPPFVLSSLRGGLNEDPPISLADDQCVVARNVEWWKSRIGERRQGAIEIDLTGSAIESCDRVVAVYRHLPTTDLADAQLWVLGITDPSTAVLAYKDTTWHTVSVSDAFTVDGVSEYQVQFQTLHGKLFIAYHSSVDRLHVWDGTTLRRTGLAEPAAPTAADQGSGSMAGARAYRVRFTVQSGGTTLRRSEPSEILSFTPSGTGAAVRVTKPASISENETHWELEGTFDLVNWYVIATTVVGTTTVDDNIGISQGYAATYDLSEDVGDYTLIPSVKCLSADEDRLLCGGGWEDSDIASRVMWTPVYNATGAGNDERLALDTDPFIDLDNFEGGDLTAISHPVNGYIYAGKWHHIYQLARTGVRTRAYEAIPLTKQRGVMPGSMIEGFDQAGQPFLFALDMDIGPISIGGPNGIVPCGADLIETWETVNLDATVVSRGVFFPEKRQAHWWIATGDSDVPDTRLVLHTNLMRLVDEGLRGGFAVWTGASSAALCVAMFSANVDDDTDRSRYLVPFIGVEGDGLVWRTDTGDDDNGAEYDAELTTKPFASGRLLDTFEIGEGELLAKATSGALLDVTVTGLRSEAGAVTKEVSGIDLTAGEDESDRVIRKLDDLGLADLNTFQLTFADQDTPSGRWQLELFGLTLTRGQLARGR